MDVACGTSQVRRQLRHGSRLEHGEGSAFAQMIEIERQKWAAIAEIDDGGSEEPLDLGAGIDRREAATEQSPADEQFSSDDGGQ